MLAQQTLFSHIPPYPPFVPWSIFNNTNSLKSLALPSSFLQLENKWLLSLDLSLSSHTVRESQIPGQIRVNINVWSPFLNRFSVLLHHSILTFASEDHPSSLLKSHLPGLLWYSILIGFLLTPTPSRIFPVSFRGSVSMLSLYCSHSQALVSFTLGLGSAKGPDST